ncbi:uncharacterized protein ACOB8E_011286 isoform 1-T7 [Sarcophilus harrisii]
MRFSQLLMQDHIPHDAGTGASVAGHSQLCLCRGFLAISPLLASFSGHKRPSAPGHPPAPRGRGPRAEGGGESNFSQATVPWLLRRALLILQIHRRAVLMLYVSLDAAAAAAAAQPASPAPSGATAQRGKKASEQRPRLPRPPRLGRRALFPQPGSRAAARAGRLLLPRFRGSRLGPRLPRGRM